MVSSNKKRFNLLYYLIEIIKKNMLNILIEPFNREDFLNSVTEIILLCLIKNIK